MASNEKLKLAFERVAREFDRVDADIAALAARGTLPDEMTIEWILYQMWETLKNKDHCCGGSTSTTTVSTYQEQAAVEQLSILDQLIADNNTHLIQTDQIATAEDSPETIALREQLAALMGTTTSTTPDEVFIADEILEGAA